MRRQESEFEGCKGAGKKRSGINYPKDRAAEKRNAYPEHGGVVVIVV